MTNPEIDSDTSSGEAVTHVPLRGRALLNDALFNKGSAFSTEERDALGLRGLLPHGVSTQAIQLERAYGNISRKTDPLEKYIGLAALQDRNETLFHMLVLKHLEEFAPIVYTPTVGRACQQYSHIFRRGRGVWLTPADRGRFAELLNNGAGSDVRLIVVTDNERILGLGDQGAGGMGIPIGKLVLYSVGAGLHPAKVLPVSLDVGTDNQALLDDPLYLGWRNPRLRGPAYDALVEEFVQAVMKCFPRALLQWEDFKKGRAFTLLDRYQDTLLSFNDDIQGTAAVTLAGVIAAARRTGTTLAQQRVVIMGAGAAGIGIGRLLRDAFARQGLDEQAAISAIAMLDSSGLLIEGRRLNDAYKSEFCWPLSVAQAHGLNEGAHDLLAVVEALKPTVLIGTTGQAGSLHEEVVRRMASHCERPAIFPLSNPTSKAEAVPADLLAWTQGRALIASGSPFEPVTYEGRTYRIGQGNNVFIFPGVGLGALASGARRVKDSMFAVAAARLAELVDATDLEAGMLYPPLGDLRAISVEVAVAVGQEAVRLRQCAALDEAGLRARIKEMMWLPRYRRLLPG